MQNVGAKCKCRVSGTLSCLEADMKEAGNLKMSAKELDRSQQRDDCPRRRER